jgi:hypothetical protein
MRERSPILCIVLIIFLVVPHAFTSLAAKPRAQFSIVYSNDVMGEVEPCG